MPALSPVQVNADRARGAARGAVVGDEADGIGGEMAGNGEGGGGVIHELIAFEVVESEYAEKSVSNL